MNRVQPTSSFFTIVAFVLAGATTSTALAHKPSDSYLRITGGGEHLTVEWDISLKDLEFLIGLDADRDGNITWGELKSQREAIASQALSHLSISADGSPCRLELNDFMVTQHSDGAYAVLALGTDCPGDAPVLNIDYSFLFDVDPTHRGLVLYQNESSASTHVLSPGEPTLELTTADEGLLRTLFEYIQEGVWHIWIGFDHILFLISLLLPAVLVLKDKAWAPVEAFMPACKSVLKVVTMFTVAHSITLWLAVMEYVTLPAQWVEATIALSIIITALNNLYPIAALKSWMIAFGFGLIHGFGFANVLIDLGLSSVALGVSLLGFNIGVELGPVAIVLVFLPVAYLLRETTFYSWVVLRAGSVVVAMIAAIWMYERIFNVEILGF